MKWPLIGGITHQKSATEDYRIERIYIGGYQNGSVRIWDATFPVLSLVSVIEFEVSAVTVVYLVLNDTALLNFTIIN